MKSNELKEIFWKDGKFLDKDGNPIEKVIPIGLPELFEINTGYELLKDYLFPTLESLQKKDKEYLVVNSYLKGRLLPYSEYSVDLVDRVAVSFYKIG
jgi:hypothetical protein